ncbi:uncharacterized protein LOC110452793 [Mizuhopecten yessoensis]|uniref:uncharacterized protein LOC110452793 n=1 Tax=Mizuhopecten yessoensis TaxID=6573 RepID=UPI000B4576E9|nr:uncharacterized protein LOC110452793 [Mizuhopecten yessoensis]
MSILHSDLLMSYNRDIRPIQNQSSVLDIQVSYAIKSLNDFDSVNGRMATTGSLYCLWRDEMMTWNPSDYGNIEKVRMRETVVWAPTILVPNGADDIYIKTTNHEDSSVLYDSTGMASFVISGVMTTTCDPDITYYPYDKHNCSLQFSTQEPMNEVSLHFNNRFILPGADSNLLWKFDNLDTRSYNIQNTNTVIEITLTLERRPTYLLYSISIPLCLLNFSNLLAFVLPADSGERVSFATTMLLTLSMFMIIMSDSIPNSSDPVSILTISLMIKLTTSSLIVFTVIVTLNVYRLSDTTPIPLWLLRVLCFHKNIRVRDSSVEHNRGMNDPEDEHPKKTKANNIGIDPVIGATQIEPEPRMQHSFTWQSNQSSVLDIQVSYSIKSLNEFDSVNGRMVTTGSLFVIWRDEMMTWNPSDYGDIEKVRMRETVVWAPTILVLNGADDIYIKTTNHEDSSILFDSTGIASFVISGVMTTTCDPDITYYPYEKHNCSLQFSTQEPMNEVSLHFNNRFILPGADSNLLWKFDNLDTRSYNIQNTNTFIEITLTLERRPWHLLYNILIPLCLLNFSNLLAFILPADSGERVSFATTMLLTLSVYMTIMSDSIPNTSDPVSILTISLMIKLTTSSLIVFTVIVTLNVYRLSDTTPIPLWLLRVLCFHKNIRVRDSSVEHKRELNDPENEHPKKTKTEVKYGHFTVENAVFI